MQKLVKQWLHALDEMFFFDKAHSVPKGGIKLYFNNKEKIHDHFAKDKSGVGIDVAHHLGRSGYLQPQVASNGSSALCSMRCCMPSSIHMPAGKSAVRKESISLIMDIELLDTENFVVTPW